MFSLANLYHQKESFYKFLEQLSDAIICVDQNFEVQYSNSAARNLLDKQLLELIVELCERRQQQIIKEDNWTDTLDYYLESGKHLQVHVTVLRDVDESPSGYFVTCIKRLTPGISQDEISQSYFETLIKLQQELAASNERFMFMNMVISDVLWDWDIVNDEIYRGEGYDKLSGNNNCRLPIKQHFQLIHNRDRRRVVNSIETALESNKEYWEEEYRFLCKDGNYHNIIDKGYIVRNEAGKPIRMIGAMEDVSQNRRLEKKLTEKEEVKKKEIIKAIIDAQEKERTQISYELHEQLSQNLATCKLLLDGLHFPESREEERIRLRSSMKLLTQTMNEIRNMSHQLNANAIKMVGLIGVMRDVTSTINQNLQVEVLLQCYGFSDSTVLPKDVEVSAFRIFQEGMNNVIRHSGATHANVQLSKKNKWLVLSITDNGKGFNVDSTPKGLGFTNIINRVDFHNGIVSINSSLGNGCALEVKLPIAENND